MTDPRTSEAMTPVKRALLEIRDLKAQLAVAERARHEPIAIVGVGLRFPGGAHDTESFARMLWSGTDAITDIPASRWSLDALYAEDPDAPGKMITRYGGFIDDVEAFDAEFFGISPREAASMDPQQRIVLQIAWEALENAGYAPDSVAGTQTGVYLGISNNDYGRALFRHPDLIDPYFSPGNAYSVAAGRLSYFLGAHGPSIAVDTACSSSLVALHLACQGLRLGECDRALAGGVNLVLTPEMNINFSKARMMAPNGRCKTFDAAADGYVRGEGCAFIVLRRLSDALAGGDRILAVVRGSAINQDGRSGGLTAPNGPAQEAVIRKALEVAQVDANMVGFVEAHGTGTPLGDPIEVGALGAVYGASRDAASPLTIGSVKTNIGHLEAAAGVAGVIKAMLSLQRHEIPPHLHFTTGNPFIDWSAFPLKVATAVTPWPNDGGRRFAGVSSFGFSGTNAHVILEEAPASADAAHENTAPGMADRPLHLLALSARDESGLEEIAQQYDARLADETAIADLCYTANAGRAHFSHRLAITGGTAAELRRGITAHLAGKPAAGVMSGTIVGGKKPQVAFLFTGQGAQYAGMGRTLYETSPIFRAALDECDRLATPHLGRSLLGLFYPAEGEATPLNETAFAQPATFAIEYALATLWRSWGIEPAIVLGHSLGEYAAACVAGVFSLEEGLRLVAERGQLTHALPSGGAMAAVFADESVVNAELANAGGALTIAAYNGPEHFVVSGPRAAVEAATERLKGRGIEVKMLRVPHAAHSPLIEPALPPFREALLRVHFSAPRIAIVSNLTGQQVGPNELARPEYWLDHMRKPVRFAQSIQLLAAQGITHFLEVGPHPVLLGMGAECLPGNALEWLPSLRREHEDWRELLDSVERLYVGGADISWAGFDNGYRRRRVAAPTYPFRKRRHWMDIVGPAPASGRQHTPEEQWERVTATLERQTGRGPVGADLSNYPAKWASLERLTNAHAAKVLREAGVFSTAGERATSAEVRKRLGAQEAYSHLLDRWLLRLAGAGELRMDGESFVADKPLADPSLAARWADAEALLADNQPLLAYVRHCGTLLYPVITGRESPLETLFPNGSFDLAEGLYEHSATLRYVNGAAASAVEAFVSARGPGDSLRVLEIGAGTGSSTAALLPLFPAGRTAYEYTDLSPAFFDRARERFAAYPFLHFSELDLERDPAEQGYRKHAYDLVFSSNTVHATRDVRRSLGYLRDLLAPGGLLVLVESTTHFAWLDMTIGLFQGWQHFDDDLRTDIPLMAPDVWIEAMREAGFADAAAYPRADSPAAHLGQHVILARAPETARQTTDASAPAAAAAQEPSRAARPAAPQVAQQLRDAMAGEREEIMLAFITGQVVSVLRLDPSDPPGIQHRLMDLGFDSLMAVQLRNRLASGLALGKSLPATLLFDYPTIEAIGQHLLNLVLPAPAAPAAPIAPTDKGEQESVSAATIAGMSDADIEKLLLERLEGTSQEGTTR